MIPCHLAPDVHRYDGSGNRANGAWCTSCCVGPQVCPSRTSHTLQLTAPPDSRARVLCQAVGAPHSSWSRCWQCCFRRPGASGGRAALLLHTVDQTLLEELQGGGGRAAQGCSSGPNAVSRALVTGWTGPADHVARRVRRVSHGSQRGFRPLAHCQA